MSVTYVDSGSLNPATGRTSVVVPIPSTPASAEHDIVIVAIYKENAAAVTPPDGTWTLKAAETTNAATQGALFVFWKRLTAAASGSYTFTWTGAIYAGANIYVARGAVRTGDPFHSFSISRTANNAGAVISASVASVADGLGLSFVSSWATASRSWTAPATWTKTDQTTVQTIGYKENMAAGSTGTITWTGNGNDYYHMFLGVLSPYSAPPAGPTIKVVVGGVWKTGVPYAIIGGAKKAVSAYAIIGGNKET